MNGPDRPAPFVPGPLGRVLERLYARHMAARNARLDAGQGVEDPGLPVVSVGNLSVGGTGKTPAVMHVLRTLRDAGRRPCVAMRGYARPKPAQPSDEEDQYRRAFPDVPVVARPDRIVGIRMLLRTPEGRHLDSIVLDDGFQHRRIARACDLVLIDATRDPFHDRLIPLGRLREPVESLRRATAVILTHAQAVSPGTLDALADRVERLTGRPPIAVTRHAWDGLDVTTPDAVHTHAGVDLLARARVLAVCAIGNPAPFLAAARAAASASSGGAATPDAAPDPLVGTLVLRDHDPYAAPTLRRLDELARSTRATLLLTTDKDWSKLSRVPPERRAGLPVARPRLVLRFDRGQPDLDRLVLRSLAPRPDASPARGR